MDGYRPSAGPADQLQHLNSCAPGQPRARISSVKSTGILLAAAALALTAGCASTPTAAWHRQAAASPGSRTTLTPVQREFVSTYRADSQRAGDPPTASDPDILGTGQTLCQDRRTGVTQSQLLANDDGDKAIVIDSEKYLCPAFWPQILLRMSGHGVRTSHPFMVSASRVTVRYAFRCPDPAGLDNFIATMETSLQYRPGSDYKQIANTAGAGAERTVIVHLKKPGSDYRVVVISGSCSWSLVVKTG